jgi:hypothetical protein
MQFPDRPRLEQIALALRRDRQRIETTLNRPCRYLAYPRGKVNALMILVAESGGFTGAVSQTGDSNPFYRHPFMIHRQPIDWGDDVDRFQKHL